MKWCPTIGMKLEQLGRVTDAEFEVIEPTKEQHGTEQSAGDGTTRTTHVIEQDDRTTVVTYIR